MSCLLLASPPHISLIKARSCQTPAMWDWLKRAIVRKVVRAGVEKNLRAAEKNLRAAEAQFCAANKPDQGALLHAALTAWQWC